jgi:RimJ/RimL family protein N-acetyltransferase
MLGLALRPWFDADLPVLEKLLGDPAMMGHLGGPESFEQIRQRHERYLKLSETDHMFVIMLDDTFVGSIGYWERAWHDKLVYETGWQVLLDYQGHGIAARAGELVMDQARSDHRHQFMHAFPSIDNPASNAICRKLGFSFIEPCELEYPLGHFMKVNDWRLDLFEA